MDKREYHRIKLIEWRKNNPKRKKELKIKDHIREKEQYPDRVRCWKNDYKKRKKYCELCGSTDKLEFHHIDYINHSGITVCFNCHRYKIHLKGGKQWKK